MKIPALLFAASIAPACLAQYEAFPDVPENHWVYQTLVKFEQAGIVRTQIGIFRTGRPFNCMQIAKMAFDTSAALLDLIEKAEWTKERKATAWRGEVDEVAFRLQALEKETASLAAIVTAFEKELKLRRVDAKQLNVDLLAFPKRIKGLLAPTQRPAAFDLPEQNSALLEQFPDIPENHWVYKTLLNLRQSNIIDVPDGFFRGSRPASTFEVADVAFDACIVLRHRFAFSGSATLKQMKLLREDIANLAKMADKFAAQYKWMLVDHVALRKEMETITEYIERARNDGIG